MQLTTKEAEKQISELYRSMKQNEVQTRKLKREYNKVVGSIYKIKDKEALIEFLYCKKLEQSQIEYKNQFIVNNGRIDILTNEYIIEIKYGSNRSTIFEAIGQLKFYSLFFPNKKLKIITTGKIMNQMENILYALNIEYEIFNYDLEISEDIKCKS